MKAFLKSLSSMLKFSLSFIAACLLAGFFKDLGYGYVALAFVAIAVVSLGGLVLGYLDGNHKE